MVAFRKRLPLGRKNSLFAGSDGGARHWAIVASLVATAKLNGVEPLAWLTDVLERMVSGRTKAHELERLLPWAWGEAVPFYAFPAEVRRLLYTTNAIEALNSKLRRAVRASGRWPRPSSPSFSASASPRPWPVELQPLARTRNS
jgi:IS66 C-terminal element/Transposase, Mutator family